MADNPSISVVIPVFNEEESFESLIPYLNHYRRSELIFINDGSIDGTKEIVNKYQFNCIDIDENRGKGNAISVGTKYAVEHGKNWIVTMDGDLQHPPELIPKFDDDGIEFHSIGSSLIFFEYLAFPL